MNIKFITLKRINNLYVKDLCNDEYLELLSDIFLDRSDLEKTIKKRLFISGSSGAGGNRTDVTFEGNVVIIAPMWEENGQDYSISVDRDVLLRLIDRWEQVIKDTPEFITLTLEGDGEISVVGSYTNCED